MLLTKTRPNLRTWSLIISALSQNGMHQEVTDICCKMQEVESAPSPTIYSSAILAVKTAASEDYGKAIHACVVKKGLLLSKSVIQSLLNMYSRFDDRGTMDGLLRLLPESWIKYITYHTPDAIGYATVHDYTRLHILKYSSSPWLESKYLMLLTQTGLCSATYTFGMDYASIAEEFCRDQKVPIRKRAPGRARASKKTVLLFVVVQSSF